MNARLLEYQKGHQAPTHFIPVFYSVKQPLQVSIKKAFFINFAIFTRKYLCWSLFLIKFIKSNFIEKDSNVGVFLRIF